MPDLALQAGSQIKLDHTIMEIWEICHLNLKLSTQTHLCQLTKNLIPLGTNMDSPSTQLFIGIS